VIRPEIDATALKRLTSELKEIDPGIASQLKKDLKADLTPFASAIQSEMPIDSPLRGMVHDSRTGWSPVKVSVGVTPGATYGKSFARIIVTQKFGEAGYKIAEFAGSASFGYTASGQAMIEKLDKKYPLIGSNRKGGRFAFAAYYRKQPMMLGIIETILNRYIDIVNKRFD